MRLIYRNGKILEPERSTPVAADVDVLVVGGGSAGWAAAVAAARNGVTTMLLEQYGFCGGMMTAAAVGTICGPYTCAPDSTRTQIVFGLCGEFMQKMESLGAGFKYLHRFQVDHERAKLVLDEFLLDAGVKVMYHTVCTDVLMDGQTIRGVVVHNKAGRQAILARVIIDATGDGDVAALARVPFEKGDPQGRLQAPTYIFDMAGVDVERAMAVPPQELRRLMRLAEQQDRVVFPRYSGGYSPLPTPGRVHVNMTRVYLVDGTDPRSLTRANVEGRRQVAMYAEFLRKYVPGFEQAYVVDLAAQIGIRETRRIRGEYVLTGEDVLTGRKFADGVCRAAWPIEMHDPEGTETRRDHLKGDDYYLIPYRCLVPLGVDQLLVAGRCLSATREGQASARVMAYAMGMGQAAGTAAALSLEQSLCVRRIDVEALQRRLVAQGVAIP